MVLNSHGPDNKKDYIKYSLALFGYSNSMWIGVYCNVLECILTCYGFKPTQYHPIHMDKR
jgi:hypothetical protein